MSNLYITISFTPITLVPPHLLPHHCFLSSSSSSNQLHISNSVHLPDEGVISVLRLQQEGHNREYERRGNKRPGALVGSDKWLLLLLRSAFPKATAAEATAFIYRNTLNHIPRIFSPSQITAAEYSLGLTRKRSSNGGVRTILMDNLSAHRSLIVQQTVMATGQQLLYRRKYSPADAPIEYVFNTCQSELHIRMREINLLNIVYLIIDIISNMNGFANYFVFCGY